MLGGRTGGVLDTLDTQPHTRHGGWMYFHPRANRSTISLDRRNVKYRSTANIYIYPIDTALIER